VPMAILYINGQLQWDFNVAGDRQQAQDMEFDIPLLSSSPIDSTPSASDYDSSGYDDLGSDI
jgi:hypothetical protein